MVALAQKPKTERLASSEANTRRRWLSDSFNRGVQTLDEATEGARAMAASLERQGLLLRAPARPR
jgi:hypothetical protein